MSENGSKNSRLGGLKKLFDKKYSVYVAGSDEAVIIPVDEDAPIQSEAAAAAADVGQAVNITEASEAADGEPGEKKIINKAELNSVAQIALGILVSVFMPALAGFKRLALFTGERTIKFFVLCADKFKSLVKRPLMFAFGKLRIGSRLILIKLARLPRTTWEDYVSLREEAAFVREKASLMKDRRRFPVAKALRRYYMRSFRRYGRFWRSVFNTVFPLAAILILISTINYRHNTAYALEVTYNGNIVGYVENEQVYNEARNTALEMLSIGGGADSRQFNSAVYSIKRVTLNKLSDASVISEKLIKSTDVGYVQACGIYIDGEFLCAVKNEADAVTVFDNLLAPYEKKAEGGDMVAFVEEIEYIQGLYANTDSVIWDSAKLKSTVESAKKAAVYYSVRAGDTVSAIAARYNLTSRELLNMNPGTREDNIYVGDVLLVSKQVNFVRVKVMKTERRTQAVAYSTVRKDSSAIYKGTTKTVQNGCDGKNLITELVTYIDGIRTYASHISTKQITAPVDKIIYVGTKAVESPSYSSSYSPDYYSSSGSSSSSGLSWPTVSAYHISSYYGYRTLNGRYKFHRGVDIVRSGGGSAGLSVIASASGTVVEAGYNGSYGNTVVIDHGGGIKTRYAHMQSGSITVYYGSYVSKGQKIGRIGSTGNSTGPHLHFEVIINGSNVNPLSYVG